MFHLVDKLLFLGNPEDLLCGVIFNPQPFRFRMGSAAVDCSVKGKKPKKKRYRIITRRKLPPVPKSEACRKRCWTSKESMEKTPSSKG